MNVEAEDAKIEISFTFEKMEAFVSFIHPTKGEGKALSHESICRQCEDEGITVQIDQEATAEVLLLSVQAPIPANITICKGKKATPGTAASLEQLVNYSSPVFPGHCFAKKHPPLDGEDGFSVDGECIESEKYDEMNLNFEGCLLADDSLSIESETYGLVQVEEENIVVTPLLRTNDDKMEAYMTLYPKDCFNESITLERVLNFLEQKGITHGIQKKSIEDELQSLSDSPKEILVAMGKRAVSGEDSYYKVDSMTDLKKGMERSDGSMDFYNRGEFKVVNKGDWVATFFPHTEGVNGFDVTGKVFEAVSGKEVEDLVMGEGIAPSEDGLHYVATRPGMISKGNGVIQIEQLLEFPNDIDFATGNIFLSNGSVHVKGDVKSNFKVVCPGDIIVENFVEDAQLNAGGNIDVLAGVAMGNGSGVLKAKGNVSVKFAQNATIRSEADVTSASFMHSQIHAAGRVTCIDGSGKLQGGQIFCGDCLEVNELGSNVDSLTKVSIQKFEDYYADFFKMLGEKERILKTMCEQLDVPYLSDHVECALFQDKEKMKLLIIKERLHSKILEMKNFITEQRIRFQSYKKRSVTVHGKLHPNTEITIDGHSLVIRESRQNCIIYFDEEEKKMQIRDA
jgi:uncharacterized protein (DUF342 family)